MTNLTCLTIFEAGSFGSSTGNVVVPDSEVPFPITSYTVGTAAGVGAAAGVAEAIENGTTGTAAGVGAANGVAVSVNSVVGSAAGIGAATATTEAIKQTVGTAAGVGATTGRAKSWQVSWVQAHNITSTGWNGFNLRQVVPASLITISGDKIRVTLGGGSLEPAAIDSCWIGHPSTAGGADAYDFDGNQVQLKLATATSFEVPINTLLLLDEVSFNLDETKNLILAAHFSNSAKDNVGARAIAGYTVYSKSAADETATSDVSTYTTGSNALRLIEQVEVYA